MARLGRSASTPGSPSRSTPERFAGVLWGAAPVRLLARDPRFQIRIRLDAGTMSASTTAALHGRAAFEERGGRRHFQGCYVEREEVINCIRVLERSSEGGDRARWTGAEPTARARGKSPALSSNSPVKTPQVRGVPACLIRLLCARRSLLAIAARHGEPHGPPIRNTSVRVAARCTPRAGRCEATRGVEHACRRERVKPVPKGLRAGAPARLVARRPCARPPAWRQFVHRDRRASIACSAAVWSRVPPS